MVMRPCHQYDTDDVSAGEDPSPDEIAAATAEIRRGWSRSEHLRRERHIERRHGSRVAARLLRSEEEPSCRSVPTPWTDRRRR